MTREQRIKLHLEGSYTPEPSMVLPLSASKVCPPVTDEMAHVRVAEPLKPENFNNMSPADIQAMHAFKEMDDLHRPDAVAKLHSRGSKLNAHLQKVGDKQFVDDYFKFSKH